MSPLNYFRQVIKRVNERENEHETQTKKVAHGVSNVYQALEKIVPSRVILGYIGFSSTI